ncbi:RNA polymerase sigma factor [Fulvivirgaceae bacterium BMA12]|uniref:RNA polymerase sigma factor n=1 Tax=Agaribacillus aureus TaxID=3051825 RepID=A0ABT8LC60_9BACT|nr:RNA polymerase sigma factor [Fulvivirgaceae bacterium BMA12]
MRGKIEILVDKANSGDRDALESVILEIKDMVYHLSLKMLLFADDAQDATQEILVRIITHLSTFKGESRFMTWVYRVATNYLLTVKGKKSHEVAMPFEAYADLIDTGQSDLVTHAKNEGELLLLEEEVKVSCTHGLLLCLNEMSRMVYILGEILEFNSVEGAEILEMTPENFRKQLSRSRVKIRHFLESKCGLVNPGNACRCKRKIDFLVEKQLINPGQLQFARHSNRSIDLIEKIDAVHRTVAIFRSVPVAKAPKHVMKQVRKVVNAINF